MENRIQYGPYSPQEVDRISVWLQQNKVLFEIIRDDQEAKEALMNDGQNIVSLAEFRTRVYLAQVFYVALVAPSKVMQEKFEEAFSLKTEVFPKARPETENEDQLLEQGKIKQQRKKRGWAMVLSLYFIVPVIVSLIFLLLKES